MRMQFGDCCAPCELDSVTLKGFSKSDGTEVWQHRLDSPVMSTDGVHIYGHAFEETDSAAAKACTIIPLYNLSGGVPLREAYNPSIRRFKKWIRKITVEGEIVADSSFFWYTGNGSFAADTLGDLPRFDYGGFQPDFFGANADGGILKQEGDGSSGAFLYGGEALISWDDNNRVTTRKYTIVAAAVRDLAPPSANGVQMRFIAEADGTNAEQTINVQNMIGKSAADIATALEAFPHIVSATGSGGPYPLENIELEIEWAQDLTHFKTVRRLESTSRSYRTWVRDWDTLSITATIPTPSGSSASANWCFATDDSVIGWNFNPNTGVPIPGTLANTTGTYFERYVGGSRTWSVAPTLDRAPIWGLQSGQTKVFYRFPSFRNGRMIVTHDTARGDGQAVGEHSEWQELNLSTGAIVTRGGKNDRWNYRATFAADNRLFYAGGDPGVENSSGLRIQYPSEAYKPDFSGLTDAISTTTENYDYEYHGPYGNVPDTSDLQSLYSRSGSFNFASDSTGFYRYLNANQAVVYFYDQKILTMVGVHLEGQSARVNPDSFFGLQRYFRLQFQLMSPANAYWIEPGMEWRIAFFSTNPDQNTAPTKATSWLAFDATETDLATAMVTLLGNNTSGPNAFVGTAVNPVGTEDVCPQMIWQRNILITLITETTSTPWGILDRDTHLRLRIQVRAAEANKFFRKKKNIQRIDWNTGDVIWDRDFGRSSYGGSNTLTYGSFLTEDFYIVSAGESVATCYSVYQWQETGYGYGTEAWVLVADYCPTGRTPAPPEGVGDFVGQYKNGICVR